MPIPRSRSQLASHVPAGDSAADQGVIVQLLMVTLVFILVMGVIGYIVTRFPELMTSDSIAVVDGVAVSVPDERKARAVRCAVEGSVSPDCPASILQTHARATIYLDPPAASLLRKK